MAFRSLKVLLVIVWYVTIRSIIYYFLSFPDDFLWWWSWGISVPITASAILVPYVTVQYIRGKL